MTAGSRIVPDGGSSALVAVVPAAGGSARFGSMKLVADVNGAPLLDRTLRCLLDSRVAHVVVVVADGQAQTLRSTVDLLDDPRVTVVINPQPDRGMFSSIQTGLAAVRGNVPVVVLPGDMPFVKAGTVNALAAAHEREGAAVVASYAGRHGHPIIVPAAAREDLLAQPPTTTLKDALVDLAMSPVGVEVDDPGVLRDVDVPRDLAP